MKRNYSKLISVTLVLVVVLTAFVFPTPVYAADKPPIGEQTAYAVFERLPDNGGYVVGSLIGPESSPVTVEVGQYVFVCIQQDFTQALKQHGMGGQWRTWGGTWKSMAIIGSGDSDAWEYWNSSYDDHTADEVTDHFVGDTVNGNYIFESDYPGFPDEYPAAGAGKHETWFVIQAPDNAGQRYEIRWWDSTDKIGLTPTVVVDIMVAVPGAPRVSTQAASSIGDNSATLSGNITDTGDADVTERGFDYGLTDSYGSESTETPGPYVAEPYNHGISGLDTGTIYHFRAKAYNSYGWAYGADMEFTTTGLPSHPYLQIVQGAPEKGSEAWFEWIVVNPSDSSETCTEVRVKRTDSFDMEWTISLKDPASGWADGDANGIYWSGSESIPSHSAKHFRVRAKVNTKIDPNAMTWSAKVTGVSVQDVTSDVSTIDAGAWGGIFYNKPNYTTEQTEATTYTDGLYAYLYEDSSNNPLCQKTEYTFYVNVHEWSGNGINAGGTLTITIPEEFTNVTLDEYTDFSDANFSNGTITGHNDNAISNGVDHLSFKATTPTGYDVDTNWEFDTRFTGTGSNKGEAVRYICEANVLVQAPNISNFPTSFNFLILDENAIANTNLDHFTITNNGGCSVDIAIKGTDLSNGTKTWDLADDDNPGPDIYALKAGLEGDGSYNIIVREDEPYNTLKSGLGEGATQKWGLEIYMPTTISEPENCADMSGIVTLIATAS